MQEKMKRKDITMGFVLIAETVCGVLIWIHKEEGCTSAIPADTPPARPT